jgi:hypothetical protein
MDANPDAAKPPAQTATHIEKAHMQTSGRLNSDAEFSGGWGLLCSQRSISVMDLWV